MKTAAVHNGKFHADDVFSIAILKLIFPELEVLRTRNPEELKKADARIDVGAKYNPEKNDFDHHQPEFEEKRENGIPYASAGLIWKYYGKKLVNKETLKMIDEKLIQQIDADDSGIKIYDAKQAEPYTIDKIINAFNPEWPDKDSENFDKSFNEAVSFATKILKKEIKLAKTSVKAKEIIKKEIEKTDREYIILEENLPHKGIISKLSEKIKFVIKNDPVDKVWAVIGVRKNPNEFEIRKNFPKKWSGLYNEELAKVSGVGGAVFCHKKLFIAIAKSKQGAIKMAELALKNEE